MIIVTCQLYDNNYLCLKSTGIRCARCQKDSWSWKISWRYKNTATTGIQSIVLSLFFFVVTRELFVHWRLFRLMKCHTFFNFATNICFIQYLFQMTAVIILLPNLDTTLDFPWMMFCGHVLICLPRGMASWKSLFLWVLYYECLKKNAWHTVQSLKGRSHC